MRNIRPGDTVKVPVGSHYGPRTWEDCTVEWASDDGSTLRVSLFGAYRAYSIAQVQLVAYATDER